MNIIQKNLLAGAEEAERTFSNKHVLGQHVLNALWQGVAKRNLLLTTSMPEIERQYRSAAARLRLAVGFDLLDVSRDEAVDWLVAAAMMDL